MIAFITKIRRLFFYEHWNFKLFFIPPFIYGIYLALKSKSMVYFSNVNPQMKFGGAFDTSKYSYLKLFPKSIIPKTVIVYKGTSIEKIKNSIEEAGIPFPLIVKPDNGTRSTEVEKVNDLNQLNKYILDSKFTDILIQDFIDFDIEIGVLYYRIPDSKTEKITSLIEKNKIEVRGDGKNTLKQLIQKNIRLVNRINIYKKRFSKRWNEVIPLNEKIHIEAITNHNRGCKFIDRSDLISEKLLEIVSKWASKMPEFYYGRFDVKIKSWDDLFLNKNYKILEVNGVNSEPTHIYDKKHSLLKAYRDTFYHMKLVYKIGEMNKKRGFKRCSTKVFLKALREALKHY